jgi:hypothetical protein
MECEFDVGDCVLKDGIKGNIKELIDVGGDCYLIIETKGGDLKVHCDEVERC